MSSEWSSKLITLLVYLGFYAMFFDSVLTLCHRFLRRVPDRIYTGLLCIGAGLAISIAVEATWVVTLHHPPDWLRWYHVISGLVALIGAILIMAWSATWLYHNPRKALDYVRNM
jgi:hypothetical protein